MIYATLCILSIIRQNVMEGIQRKSYSDSEVVIEWVRKRARVFVGDLIVRKTES